MQVSQPADRARRGIGHPHRCLFERGGHVRPCDARPHASRAARVRRGAAARPPSEASAARPRPRPLNTDWKACVAFDTGGLGDKGFNDLAKKGLERREGAGLPDGLQRGPGRDRLRANIQTPHRRGLPVDRHGRLQPGPGDGRRRPRPTPTSRSRRSTPSGTRPTNGPTPGQLHRPGLPDRRGGDARGLPRRPASARARIIGTYGGQQFPGVTRFMDGMYAGIQDLQREERHRPSKLLGWDAAKQTGTFVGGDNPWGDPAKGEQLAKTFLDQGVDIVHPVAGATGNGTIKAMLAAEQVGHRRRHRPGDLAGRVRQGDPDLRTEGHRRRGPRDDQEELRRRPRRRELRRHARQQAASRSRRSTTSTRRSRPTSRPRSTQLQGGHRLRHGQGLPTTSSRRTRPTRRPTTPPAPGPRGRAACYPEDRPRSDAPRAQGHHEAVSRACSPTTGSRSRPTAARSWGCSARTAPARPP